MKYWVHAMGLLVGWRSRYVQVVMKYCHSDMGLLMGWRLRYRLFCYDLGGGGAWLENGNGICQRIPKS